MGCHSGCVVDAMESSFLPWRLAEVIKGRIFAGLGVLVYLTQRFQTCLETRIRFLESHVRCKLGCLFSGTEIIMTSLRQHAFTL